MAGAGLVVGGGVFWSGGGVLFRVMGVAFLVARGEWFVWRAISGAFHGVWFLAVEGRLFWRACGAGFWRVDGGWCVGIVLAWCVLLECFLTWLLALGFLICAGDWLVMICALGWSWFWRGDCLARGGVFCSDLRAWRDWSLAGRDGLFDVLFLVVDLWRWRGWFWRWRVVGVLARAWCLFHGRGVFGS